MEQACYYDPNKDNKIIVIFSFPDMTIKSLHDKKNKLSVSEGQPEMKPGGIAKHVVYSQVRLQV